MHHFSALVRYLVGYEGWECGQAILLASHLGDGVRHGLRDVRALRLDPFTHDKHGIEGADTAIEAGRP